MAELPLWQFSSIHVYHTQFWAPITRAIDHTETHSRKSGNRSPKEAHAKSVYSSKQHRHAINRIISFWCRIIMAVSKFVHDRVEYLPIQKARAWVPGASSENSLILAAYIKPFRFLFLVSSESESGSGMTGV